MSSSDVIVLGAGAIGAAVAWRCARRGLSVTLVDPSPSAGAWATAAGMLAPVTELAYTEPDLLALGLDSLARYPAFVAELEDESDLEVGYRESGTLCVAWDAADLAGLRDVHRFATGLGVSAELVTGRELRSLESAVAPGLPGALLAPGDHSVDPRALHAALLVANERFDVRTVPAAVEVRLDGMRVRGVRSADGTVHDAPHVVIAAGCWSSQLRGLPFAVPVRPVKGQTLRLRLPQQPLTRVLRGIVRGAPIYVVPRDDGRLVVGASSEEADYDTTPRAGAVYELLRDAQSVLPELGEAALDEVCTGLRPATPDNLPLVGTTEVEGVLLATGHFRNGVLHTPVTADGIAELICDGTLPRVLDHCAPMRFASEPVSAQVVFS